MNIEKVIVEIHGVVNTQAMLKLKPKDAIYIAVNRHKCGSIFYKVNNGIWFADFLNGRGWTEVKQNCEDELIRELGCLSFFLARIDILEKEVELNALKQCIDLNKFHLLEQHISTRIETVGLRRGDGNDSYWNGHIDAYDTVKLMMRKIAELV